MTCGYCRAQNQVLRRSGGDFGIPAPSAPLDENERLRRLRSQDGQPLVPPAALRPLLGPSGIHPAKVNEAFHVFQATRKEVETTHSPDAAERLYLLALILNTHLGLANEEARRRALLETTLETVSLPRHIQVMRCMLASASAKEGDIPSAERWLAPCDARTDVLESDSALRAARAFVETAKGNFEAVVQTLGAHDQGYPIADAWDPTCAVLRANALERTDRLELSVTALRERMGKEGHAGRAMIKKIIDANPEMSLCPKSFPMALGGHTKVAARQASNGVGGTVGAVFYWVGLVLVVGGTLLALAIGAVILIPVLSAGGSVLEGGGAALFAAAVTWVSIVAVGLPFMGIGYVIRKKAKEAGWLRENGISCTGTVRDFAPTGTTINDVPLVRVRVDVNHPHSGTYATSFDQLLSGGLQQMLYPGAEVPLRVHPHDPSKVILEVS